MIHLLPGMVNLGLEETMDFEERKRLRLINSMALVSIPFALITGIYLLVLLGFSWILLSFLLLFTAAIALPLLFNARGYYIAAKVTIDSVSIGVTLVLALTLGEAAHVHYFLITGGILPFVFFSNNDRKLRIIFLALTVCSYLFAQWHFKNMNPFLTLDEGVVSMVGYANDVMIFIFLYLLITTFQGENEYHIRQNDRKSLLLEEKNQQLEEKNRELENFAYIASHDLNEPLRTVDNFVGLIKEEYHDPKDENLNIYFRFIHQALDRMREMIKYLLEYSRIGSSSDFQTLDMSSLVDDLLVDLDQVIAENNVRLDRKNLQPVVALPMLKQVFSNLVANGIKFQRKGAQPVIGINQKEYFDRWEFCVNDNGIGMDAEKRDDIFQMFRKLHLRTEYAGHGIGLAFSKKIVELHGGRIWVESEIDRGSEFYFTIPKNLNSLS